MNLFKIVKEYINNKPKIKKNGWSYFNSYWSYRPFHSSYARFVVSVYRSWVIGFTDFVFWQIIKILEEKI